MKPCSRLGILGILTVPILLAPLVLAGPTSAASMAVGIPISGSHPTTSPGPDSMAGMHEMPGMDGPHDMNGMSGMDGSHNMDDMSGMENMPGMESTPDDHGSHGSSEAASTGPEPARGVVLAGFGIFNLLVLLIAAVVRYSGGGSRRNRRNTARRASKPASTPKKSTSGRQPS